MRVTVRGWVGIGMGVAGVGLGLAGADAMLRAGVSPGVVGVGAVLMWGPWMLLCLWMIHVIRAIAMRWGTGQSEAEFLSELGPVDRSLACAVRRSLAAVYGVRVDRIRAGATGRSLSWWMESPQREEFCAIFLSEWGCGMSPGVLADRLGKVTARDTVAHLVQKVAAATGR